MVIVNVVLAVGIRAHRDGAGGCCSQYVAQVVAAMTTSTNENSTTLDSPQESTVLADFETAQQQVFDEAGIEPRSLFVNLRKPRIRIHVLELGDPDKSPPLLFLHPAGLFGATFAPLLATLHDTWMIVIDLPGAGLSDDFVYTAESYRRTVSDVLTSLLDELGIQRVDLVGSSSGGYWSVVFGLTHPHRVRRLVLLGGVPSFPGTRPPLPFKLMTVPVLGRLLSGLRKPGEENIMKLVELAGESEAIRRYPALLPAMVAHDRIPRPTAVRISDHNSLLSIRGWRAATRLREEEVRAIRHSPLFIWGERDFLAAPEEVRNDIESIPGARLAVVDAGHGPWFGHPTTCARLIRETRE